jgi:methanogenic corrinoid protein MtbC1
VRGAPGDPGPAAPRAEGARDDEVEALLALLRRHDAKTLRHGLEVAAARHGLRAFVLEVAAPLTRRVGEAWMQGELRIFEEHLYTECLESLLHAALNSLPAAQLPPRVLLATVPGEPHGLGLLMAQAMLALDDSACLSLGVQVPLGDIVAAAAAWPADVVALSVTGCMKTNLVRASLAQLRGALPAPVALWVGGAAPALARRPLAGITRLATLESIGAALGAWRAAATTPSTA